MLYSFLYSYSPWETCFGHSVCPDVQFVRPQCRSRVTVLCSHAFGGLHYMPHIFAFSIYRFSIFSFVLICLACFFFFSSFLSAGFCCCFVACHRLEYISSILLKLWKWMKYLSAAVHSTCTHSPIAPLPARWPRPATSFERTNLSKIAAGVHLFPHCHPSPVRGTSLLPTCCMQRVACGKLSNPFRWCEFNRCAECYLRIPSNWLQISIPFRFRLSTAIRFSLCGSLCCRSCCFFVANFAFIAHLVVFNCISFNFFARLG